MSAWQFPLPAGTGLLSLVPTPVGNLEDMTFRAVRVLSEAELILAEDTRVSRRLLDHYSIRRPLESYHQHNEHRLTEGLVNRLHDGARMALITDAGTPGIADPGFLLVRACRQAGVAVECLPGATALIPALAASGIPCDRFVFEGFLPPKKGRRTRLQEIATQEKTCVLYESPHRLLRCLRELAEHCGSERYAGVFRELSKLHEEHRIGSLGSLIADFEQREQLRGEFVIVLSGA